WERRHGFPAPARTRSNQRLYTERDRLAITWLLNATASGQSVNRAIAMLKRAMSDAEETSVERPRPEPQPLPTLSNALASDDLASAQEHWDDLALAISPTGLGHAILDLLQKMRAPLSDRARAFLLRKATVLLDASDPDRGQVPVAIITTGSPTDD